MIMFLLGILFFIGAAFLFVVAGSLVWAGGIATILIIVGLCLMVNWISNLGGKPEHFLPGWARATDIAPNDQRAGITEPGHIGNAKGRTSLDDLFD